MVAGQQGRSRRHARPSRTPARVGALLAALVLLAVGVVAGFALGRAGGAQASPAPTAAPQPAAARAADVPGPPTLLATVTRVVSGDRIMVAVGDREETVRVLGLDAPDLPTAPGAGSAQCGSAEALAFADDRLTGETVTLVPDPTAPEVADDGARLAYVVLRSQLNFTDAALIDGIARADTSIPLWYAEVFAREQQSAIDDERGIWGAPCNETPGNQAPGDEEPGGG